MTEAQLMKQIMLGAWVDGARLFRNQVGRYKLGDGYVTSGLCVGSSDLIGWTPVQIHGRTVAVFTAIEVKGPTGKATREQLRFLDVVRERGGIACVARSLEDVAKAIREFER